MNWQDVLLKCSCKEGQEDYLKCIKQESNNRFIFLCTKCKRQHRLIREIYHPEEEERIIKKFAQEIPPI